MIAYRAETAMAQTLRDTMGLAITMHNLLRAVYSTEVDLFTQPP